MTFFSLYRTCLTMFLCRFGSMLCRHQVPTTDTRILCCVIALCRAIKRTTTTTTTSTTQHQQDVEAKRHTLIHIKQIRLCFKRDILIVSINGILALVRNTSWSARYGRRSTSDSRFFLTLFKSKNRTLSSSLLLQAYHSMSSSVSICMKRNTAQQW